MEKEENNMADMPRAVSSHITCAARWIKRALDLAVLGT